MIRLTYDNQTQRADLASPIDTDEGLETAVLVSLFTDARARAGDDGIDAGIDPRGWWGETYIKPSGPFGSRLWEIKRGKITSSSTNQAVAFAEEALKWLVDANVATSVKASATRLRPDTILLQIDIQRPQKTAPRWSRHWEVQLGL